MGKPGWVDRLPTRRGSAQHLLCGRVLEYGVVQEHAGVVREDGEARVFATAVARQQGGAVFLQVVPHIIHSLSRVSIVVEALMPSALKVLKHSQDPLLRCVLVVVRRCDKVQRVIQRTRSSRPRQNPERLTRITLALFFVARWYS